MPIKDLCCFVSNLGVTVLVLSSGLGHDSSLRWTSSRVTFGFKLRMASSVKLESTQSVSELLNVANLQLSRIRHPAQVSLRSPHLEPEVILEELDGQVSLKPGKHRCNQACDFSTDTRERLDTHLCIEHMVFRTKCEQCDYSSEYPSVLRLRLV